jgi:hypothetical protein
VMPPKGAPMPEADIVRIQRWVDHGTPEVRSRGGRPHRADARPRARTGAPRPRGWRSGRPWSLPRARPADGARQAVGRRRPLRRPAAVRRHERKSTDRPTRRSGAPVRGVVASSSTCLGTGKVKMLEPGTRREQPRQALKGAPDGARGRRRHAAGEVRGDAALARPCLMGHRAPPPVDRPRAPREVPPATARQPRRARPAPADAACGPRVTPHAPAAAPTPTGDTSSPLSLVGEGTLALGDNPATTDDGNAAPKVVARDAAAWTRIFDEAPREASRGRTAHRAQCC